MFFAAEFDPGIRKFNESFHVPGQFFKMSF